MRIRLFLALASVGFVAAGLGIQACGGSSESTETKDSGAVEAGPKDAARDTNEEPACDPKKDFLADIPDASIADGASSSGVCVSCTKAKCSTEVAKCAADCPCQGIAGDAIECYVKTQNILACAGSLGTVSSGTQAIGLALFSCIQKECDSECAASSFIDGGVDAGEDAAADAATDATADADSGNAG